MRKKRFRNQDRTGAAAIEFALVVPLFLLVITGIVEFGQAFRTQHVLSTASRRGARALSIDSEASGQVQDDITTYCEQALGDVPVNIDFEVNGSNGWGLDEAKEGDAITVTVSVPYADVGIAFFAKLLSATNLSSTCTLEHE
jgi:Flp pilus assembly protein TadG